MHIAVGETNQSAGDAATRPEDDIGIGAAGGRHGFELKFDFLFFGHTFETFDDLRMVAAAAGDSGPFAEFDVAVLLLIDGGVIRGVGDIDNESAVWFQGVSDLACAEQADFLHNVRDSGDLSLETAFLFAQQAQSFRDGEGTDLIVEGAADGEVASEKLKFVDEGDWVADLDPLLGIRPGADADVDEDIFDFRNFAFAFQFGEVRSDIANDAADGTFFWCGW